MGQENKMKYEKLSNQPLVLVLAQIRFTNITLDTKGYLSLIKDGLRKMGFPIQNEVVAKELNFSPAEGTMTEKDIVSWEFRSANNKSTLILAGEQLTLLTSEYDRFETEFFPKFLDTLKVVFKVTEHDKYGYVSRLGLRYVDLISDGQEDYRLYLNGKLCGCQSDLFMSGTDIAGSDISGIIKLDNDERGSLRARVLQNRLGFDVSPDLAQSVPPAYQSKAREGDLATLLDIDCSWEVLPDGEQKTVDYSWIEEMFASMHNSVTEFFFETAITDKAKEVWK